MRGIPLLQAGRTQEPPHLCLRRDQGAPGAQRALSSFQPLAGAEVGVPETEAGWPVGEKGCACSQNRPFQAPPAPLAAGLGPGEARAGRERLRPQQAWGTPSRNPPAPASPFPLAPLVTKQHPTPRVALA